MRAFQKIVVLLYKGASPLPPLLPLRCLTLFFFSPTADVLSEEAILKWYSDAHLSRGKSVFLEQMKQFVEWLKNAEEGKKLAFIQLCAGVAGWVEAVVEVCSLHRVRIG